MDSNLQVYIGEEPGFDALSFTIWQKYNGKTYVMSPVEFTLKEVPLGQRIEQPTFRIAGEIALPFMKAWAEALSNYGVRTQQDATMIGTLEATKIHLKDLQKIVFKKKTA